MTYQNLSSNPSTVSRIVTYQVNNGLSMNALSNVVVNNITIATVGDPPLVTNQDPATLAYTQGSAAVAVFPNMLVADPKESFLSSATVQVTGRNATSVINHI